MAVTSTPPEDGAYYYITIDLTCLLRHFTLSSADVS